MEIPLDPRQTYELKTPNGRQSFQCRYLTRGEARQFRKKMAEAKQLEFAGKEEEADAALQAAIAMSVGEAVAPEFVRAMESMTERQVMDFLDSIELAQWLSEEQLKKSGSPSPLTTGSFVTPDATANATPATTSSA